MRRKKAIYSSMLCHHKLLIVIMKERKERGTKMFVRRNLQNGTLHFGLFITPPAEHNVNSGRKLSSITTLLSG
jgi:hypothetical protein